MSPLTINLFGALTASLADTPLHFPTDKVRALLAYVVMEQGRPATMPWTYAYFELAERNPVVDPSTGELVRFEGFLGPQATNLFEMTRVDAK